ncbi:TonB family protein, partial [candidate division KSB1 bacterium]|nr:TonB family protein [candidate division KSB1 bacterium]
NVRVEFSFTQITLNQPQLNVHLQPFQGYNWMRVMAKEFFNDIYFKLIFLFFLLLNSIILFAYKDIKIVRKQEDIQKQTERLMKVSMRIFPKKELDAQIKQLTQPEMAKKDEAGEKKEDKRSEQNQSRTRQRSSEKKSSGNQNSGGGILGVIAGKGSSNQGSSVLDFLVDKGLTSELTSAMGSGSNLRVGKGGSASNSEDLLSGIIGTGGDGGLGGIDDLIDEYVEDEVKTSVKLEKKSQIQVEKPTESNISQEAQGFRTEQSVMAIINKIQGRLQYIFEKYLKRDTEFRGKVTIELTIAANGTISSARIRASSTGNPAFDQEILQTIKRLKFPAIPQGTANFVIPFVFQRMG